MAHLSYQELSSHIQEVHLIVPVWSSRAHYKHPDVFYVIRDIVIDEKTDTPAIVYQKEWDKLWIKFVRLASSFLQEVSDGMKRFMKV